MLSLAGRNIIKFHIRPVVRRVHFPELAMAGENGVCSDVSGPREEGATSSKGPEDQTGIGDEKANAVPFYKLFSFADKIDVLLMVTGTVGAIGNGLSLPLMTILFGELIDSFGMNQNNGNVVHVVSKVRYVGDVAYICML